MSESTGVVQRLMSHLFGSQASRLTERAAPAHWLSYVLILSQSAAVLLVFGHAELPLLGNPSWAVRAIAAMGLFVLLATVFPAAVPVLPATLTTAGRELVGAHVERQLSALDIAGVALPDPFRLYAAMARPPRSVRTPWNGWLVRRELAAEGEEERQTQNVVDALEE